MADSQKPIKNSLLSAATGSNFFEDAALFVPVVPLVETPESQAPATAEIDLNSDDSSPNRGSVERDLAEHLTLSETAQDALSLQPQLDDPPPAISLFSRAASSGGDLFSRMLAGASVVKPGNTAVATSQHETAPPSSGDLFSKLSIGSTAVNSGITSLPTNQYELTQSLVPPRNTSSTSLKDAEEEEAPSVVSLFSAPPSRQDTVSPAVTHTDFLSNLSQTSSTQSFFSPTDENNVASTASLFSPNSAFVPVPPSVTSPSSHFSPIQGAPISTTTAFPPQLPNYSTPRAPAPRAPVASAFSVSDTISGPTLSAQPSLTSIPSSLPPMVPFIPTSSGVQPQSVAQNVPNQSLPPQATGNPNAFRLGAQRMKYVPCPEMKSVPQQTPAAPQQHFPFNPVTIPSSSSPLTSTFTPAPPMGAHISTTPLFSQGPAFPSAGVTSPIRALSTNQFAGRPTTPPRMTNASTLYGPPGGHVQTYGPQELPPLTYHWFYRKDVDGKIIWKPFSIIDSVALEDAFINDPGRLVPTDGGRYDVCVQKRLKTPVYWEESPIEVRRGSWFFKGPMDNRFIPYDEEFAVKLESEYADCMRTGAWQKRLEFPDGESVIMHSAGVVVHFCQAAAPDDWGNLPESQIRPRVVKRGVEEIEVEDGESTQIDHLVFVVHGIGPICDFKLRNIVEAVDDFRGLSFQLLHSHFRESIDKNMVGRVEFLPVSWHKALHGDKGIDEQLKRITLRSIPKFRDFTNDTLLDILFYTSPVYCQTIIDSVSSELNRMFKLFLSRNQGFHGKVSLTGHSLGSLILFDLLAHQTQTGSADSNSNLEPVKVDNNEVDLASPELKTEEVVGAVGLHSSSSRTVSYTVGTAGTGQPFITYPNIDFSPNAFFALGSPIAMFVTVRGIEKLGNDFRFPTCPAFFNIFHPYDPVAYRIETLIDPDFQNRPVLIPHHKGRKRIHLELKETMARVGADIKHKVIDAVKNTINTVYHYTGFSKTGENLDNEIQSAIAGEMEKKSEADGAEEENSHIQIGSLNGGRRIDHVLQEAPYETFNEYVFAMSTHVGYWESEDTMLLILTEIYGSMGIQRDRQVAGPQSITSPTQLVPGGTVSNTNNAAPSILRHYDQMTSYLPSAPPMQASAHAQTSQTMFNMSSSVGPPAAAATPSPQAVPMIQPTNLPIGVLLPPNPVQGSTPSQSTKPQVIGNRPITDPSYYPRGMDPTAPMLSLSQTQILPPPKVGFVPKQN